MNEVISARGGGKTFSMVQKYEIEYQQILMGMALEGQPQETIITNLAHAISEMSMANHLTREQMLVIMVVEYHKSNCRLQTELSKK